MRKSSRTVFDAQILCVFVKRYLSIMHSGVPNGGFLLNALITLIRLSGVLLDV